MVGEGNKAYVVGLSRIHTVVIKRCYKVLTSKALNTAPLVVSVSVCVSVKVNVAIVIQVVGSPLRRSINHG